MLIRALAALPFHSRQCSQSTSATITAFAAPAMDRRTTDRGQFASDAEVPFQCEASPETALW
jgi:hypothetical protein